MKRYFIFFGLLTIFTNTTSFSKFGGGTGTEIDPYQIWDKQDFIEFVDSVNRSSTLVYPPSDWHWGKHFRLMDNIETITEQITGYFIGYLHGNSKKITVEINQTYYYASLFSSVEIGGTIDSLTVEGYINGAPSGIVVHNFGTINNCINNTVVINPYTHLDGPGGITYSNSGTISHCINNGDITGVDRIGGIAGENEGTIINCINTGKITATASGDNNIFSGVGGIVGTVANSCQNILNCVNIGSVVGQGFVGGIVGLANGHPMAVTPITNCINYGYVRGMNIVGGVLGYMFNQNVNVTNCVNVGVVEGEEDIGSIVGKE